MSWREDAHINKLRVGELGKVATGGVSKLTETGAVGRRAAVCELNHASTIIAATMDATNHPGVFTVVNNSSGGTAAHTVTLTSGTWNGTATIVTLNAPAELIQVVFDESGNGRIISNVGAVALS